MSYKYEFEYLTTLSRSQLDSVLEDVKRDYGNAIQEKYATIAAIMFYQREAAAERGNKPNEKD